VPNLRDDSANERWHEIQDEELVLAFGRQAAAGAIMVVLTNLLRRLWADMGEPKWRSGTLVNGRSFGEALEASANNFRHHDEWAKAHIPNKRQLTSIAVIKDVLGQPLAPDGAKHGVSGNACPEVLNVLSGRNYSTFNERLFEYVRVLAGVWKSLRSAYS
jgi:hypothetical protein